jgi:transposase-like protein
VITHLCPKCLDKEEVVMKRISVSKAVSKTRVDSFFTNKYVYLPYHCPKCKHEEKYATFRWHFLEGSWICLECENDSGIEEIGKSVQDNIIKVDYRCPKCENVWTTRIRYYPI